MKLALYQMDAFANKVFEGNSVAVCPAFRQLIPYWSAQLNKTKLSAKQISKRGGEVNCETVAQSVKISGKAVQYMTAELEI
jgi:predicted PhzF superfamily epimerase YddE/YHI9